MTPKQFWEPIESLTPLSFIMPVPIPPVRRFRVALRIGSLRRDNWSATISVSTVRKAIAVKARVSVGYDGLEALHCCGTSSAGVVPYSHREYIK